MISIRLKKGFSLTLSGTPSSVLQQLGKPTHVAVLPERIPFIKPRLSVKEGDAVKIGSLLFYDKLNPDIKFLSPGGGTVAAINLGLRRVIREIVIGLDAIEANETFAKFSAQDLETLERDRLIKVVLDGGLWPLLRQLPFRHIPKPDGPPAPALFIHLDNNEPFQPDPQIYLKDKTDLFEYGLKALARLSGVDPYVCVSAHQQGLPVSIARRVTHRIRGNYPATDPGVILFHSKTSPAQNRAWYISGQDVLLMADLLKNGRYPIRRTMVLSGSGAKTKAHYQTRIGIPLAHLVNGQAYAHSRYIAGGVFRGYQGAADGYMGLYETGLTLMPEGDLREFLALLRPGFHKPTYSRAFLSYFNQKPLDADCNLHGGLRACIACGYCARVCPVDILPQLTFKSILAEEVEEALAHGLLDCVECGLCSYVCPSKIELLSIFKTAKNDYYKEQMSV